MRLASVLDSPALAARRREQPIALAGAELVADPAGALYWPEQRLLVIADLHLEKGSSFARRGVLLPPYDTATTLARLGALIAFYEPRIVVALGDNFHDGGGPGRLVEADRSALSEQQRRRDWIWVTGNHDPDPAEGIGGSFAGVLAVGALVFRHQPSARGCVGEVSGHLHPVARISVRGRAISRRCFVCDDQRMIVPAFGAYAGGLNVRHRAFADLFGGAFTAHLLGPDRIYAIKAARCLPD